MVGTYPICDDPISRSARRSFPPFTDFAPKSPFLFVYRSPTQYDFHVGVKAIRYSVNTAQLLILLISGGSRHSDGEGEGGRDSHPDPEIRGMPGRQKNFFFRPFGPQFGALP